MENDISDVISNMAGDIIFGKDLSAVWAEKLCDGAMKDSYARLSAENNDCRIISDCSEIRSVLDSHMQLRDVMGGVDSLPVVVTYTNRYYGDMLSVDQFRIKSVFLASQEEDICVLFDCGDHYSVWHKFPCSKERGVRNPYDSHDGDCKFNELEFSDLPQVSLCDDNEYISIIEGLKTGHIDSHEFIVYFDGLIFPGITGHSSAYSDCNEIIAQVRESISEQEIIDSQFQYD